MAKLITLIVLIATTQICLSGYPIAVFHGLGDMCLLPPMREFAELLGKGSDSKYHCFESGGLLDDYITSFAHQAEKACKNLNNNQDFQGKDISVVGLSQGGLIARSIVESCEFGGSVKKFISIGGPQMGVAKFPSCDKKSFVCDLINGVTESLVYYPIIQSTIGPAGYFKIYNNIERYVKGSTFLAELNNERIGEKTELHKKRMESLEKMILIMFEKDTMITPKESAWFQFYNPSKELEGFRETEVYTKDLLGLVKLDKEKKIEFFSINADHLGFTDEDIKTMVIPYLK